MNAKNMSTLLTGDGIGIRINDSSIRVAEQLDRLKGLYSFISLAGNTIDAKAMKLEAS
jgi:isocitrate/isopropylmalate dehydrogenase